MTDKVRIIRGDYWAALLKDELSRSDSGTAEWMEDHTNILKSDMHSLSGLMRMDGQVCFLKLYRFKSLLHKLQFRLGMGRPLRNFTAARDLDAQGLAVPRPFACLLVPEGMLLLIEGLAGPGTLAELWRRAGTAGDESGRLMRGAGETLATLHRSGFAHGDCKWNNLFWDGHRVCLIDLDDARKSSTGSKAQSDDLARFIVNAEELSIGSDMFEQFLAAYLEGVVDTRRTVIDRMLPSLLRYRKKHLARYGPHGQRLV
jgi:tRNA A-37 threonylcarbamoyl transferase component Bud32